MGVNELLCNFCLLNKDANQLSSLRKSVFGRKLVDILHIVSQRDVSNNAPIQICSLCVNKLFVTTEIVERSIQVVQENCSTLPQKKNIAKPNATIGSEAATSAAGGEASVHQQKKEKQPASAVGNDENKIENVTQKDAPPVELFTALNKVPTPNKIVNRRKSESFSKAEKNIDELDDAVKIIPSKAKIAQRRKSQSAAFIKLFAVSQENGLNEDEDEIEDNKASNENPPKPKISDFTCKLCDFQAKTAKLIKDHLKNEHNQQRPRIYDCTMCSKSFGLLKSLKEHLATHSLPSTNLTSLNANPKKKAIEKVQNTEYTFAVKNTETSTPKPAESKRVVLEFQCEICDAEFKTLRAMQTHMKTAHEIEHPKLFKCELCDRNFSSKQGRNRHLKEIHKATEAENVSASKRQRPETEDDVSDIDHVDETLTSPSKKKSKLPSNEAVASPKKTQFLVPLPAAKTASPKSNGLNNSHTYKTVGSVTKLNRSNAMDEDKSIDEKVPDNSTLQTKSNNTKVAVGSVTKLNRSNAMDEDKSIVEEVPEISTSQTKFNNTKVADSKAKHSPKKAVKKKEPKVNGVESPKKHKPNDIENDIIEIPDEVNVNVKPHSRKILQSESSLDCTHCGKTMESRQRLDSHLQKKHSKNLKCPLCQQRSPGSLEYIAHFAEGCTPTDGLPCGVKKCIKKFEDANFLSSHLRKKHDWI